MAMVKVEINLDMTAVTCKVNHIADILWYLHMLLLMDRYGGWIPVIHMKPKIGQDVMFKLEGDLDEDAIEGTYEAERYCVLGRRCGPHGEGFQDDLNKLPCDADLWIPIN